MMNGLFLLSCKHAANKNPGYSVTVGNVSNLHNRETPTHGYTPGT
jgi:hypothetical protein